MSLKINDLITDKQKLNFMFEMIDISLQSGNDYLIFVISTVLDNDQVLASCTHGRKCKLIYVRILLGHHEQKASIIFLIQS